MCKYAIYRQYLASDPFSWRQFWLRETPLPDHWDADETEASQHLSSDQIDRLLESLRKEASRGWNEHRLYALAATVAFTGLRKAEAIHLQVRDWRQDLGLLDVVPRRHNLKTKAAAAPVVAPDALDPVLREWLPKVSSLWLFPTQNQASPWTSGMPGRKPLDQLKSAGLRAGIENVTFLALRHSWATHAESRWCLSEGQIQRQLRHTRPTTQKHYRHADVKNLREAIRDIRFDAGQGLRVPHFREGEEVRHGTEAALRA